MSECALVKQCLKFNKSNQTFCETPLATTTKKKKNKKDWLGRTRLLLCKSIPIWDRHDDKHRANPWAVAEWCVKEVDDAEIPRLLRCCWLPYLVTVRVAVNGAICVDTNHLLIFNWIDVQGFHTLKSHDNTFPHLPRWLVGSLGAAN